MRCCSLVPVSALLAVLCLSGRALAGQSTLISETTAAQHGLVRPWFTQLDLMQERARVHDIIRLRRVLYVQTDTAIVQAMDAETGKTLWTRRIGRAKYPSLTPGANQDQLVIINGSRLYVVNRHNGNLLYERYVDRAGAPDSRSVQSGSMCPWSAG